MKFSLFQASDTDEVIKLFDNVFSASEGEEEGKIIAVLASNLISKTKPEDLLGFVATDHGTVVGCIFFSRFTVPGEQIAFLLSPVAIATEVQGTGIGQQLIRYGLECLSSRNVDLVLTYGDPAFYAKIGFKPISESVVSAPFPLSQPAGWLAQSLDGEPVQALHGATKCVEALSDPGYW